MATDEYTPVACDGKYGYVCSANVTAKQLVEVTGDGTVGPAAETSEKVVGVAAFTQVQNGQVLVWPIDELQHESKVAATKTLTAGNGVKAGARGCVEEYTDGTDPADSYLGVCTVGATAGNLARWVGR